MPYDTLTKEAFPLCLIVGNEVTGVSPSVVAAADMAVDIPMYGVKQSLNAAVAYGIACEEVADGRRKYGFGRRCVMSSAPARLSIGVLCSAM